MGLKICVASLLLAAVAYAEEVYAIFNAQAIRDANLSLGSSGIVTKIYVDVGSEVKEGDILLTLFNKDQSAQVDSIRQTYLFNKKQYERYERSGGAVDKNTLNKYYADYKRYEADLAYQLIARSFFGLSARK